MTVLKEINLKNKSNEKINPATEESIQSIIEKIENMNAEAAKETTAMSLLAQAGSLLTQAGSINNQMLNMNDVINKLNSKTIPGNAISYFGGDLVCALSPDGQVISWDENRITFYGPSDFNFVANNCSCLISDSMNHGIANRLWYSRNIDVDVMDNWQIVIDNSKLIKGDPLTNYQDELNGSTLYIAKIENVVADTVVRDLLTKWTLINDQTYDLCQRIKFDADCSEVGGDETNKRVFRIKRTKLNFSVDNSDVVFGVVFISSPNVEWAEKYAVGVGGQLIFDTVFTVDPADSQYLTCVCSAANLRTNTSTSTYVPAKTQFPDANAVFFIGIPKSAAKANYYTDTVIAEENITADGADNYYSDTDWGFSAKGITIYNETTETLYYKINEKNAIPIKSWEKKNIENVWIKNFQFYHDGINVPHNNYVTIEVI
ncbi:MAG TPA: hypothetical protein PKY81_17135 [bacterium]|nr:hypothetical protein [bacterium]